MAARFKTCSIDGCNGNAHDDANGARGWCNAHYRRWRRLGDPAGGGTSKGEPLAFLTAAIEYDGDGCLRWPYSKDRKGYGKVYIDGKYCVSSRVVCERAHGPAPSRAHEAAHSCGKGHLGCIAPGHLSWKTRAENQADRIDHGTHTRGERGGSAKLTELQISEIRALRGKMPNREIAATFRVSDRTVRHILNGTNWAWMQDDAT